MPRISTYTKDVTISDEDLLVGSNYVRTYNGIKEYNTRSFKLEDLAVYYREKITEFSILDEDNMASDSATKAASQQSVKAYVDSQIATEDTIAELNDTTIGTLANAHLLIYDNDSSVWENKALSGDVLITKDGVATIQANSVALTTDTTGNYVATVTAGTGLTSSGATSGEGIAHSLSVDASQTQITAVGTIATGTWQGTAIDTAYLDTTLTSQTSILNTSLVTGRDADNQIKYSTDNQIIFRVDGGDNVVFKASGEIEATSLDISGDADIDGTLEADAITVDGTALNEYIADTTGAMFTSNTETFISATYEDGDNTIDLVVPVKDEDNMASDSATHLATQQSIKAYVDAQVDTEDTLAELDDTNISSAAAGQILVYDNTASVWDNVALTAGDLIDVTGGDGTLEIDVDLTEAAEAAIANGDYMLFLDGGATGAPKKEALHDIATLFSGTGLTATNSVIAVDAAQTQITSVGTLAAGAISSGFGNIDNGSSTFNTGAATVDSLSVSDGNITNVGDIALDTISADGTTINVAMTDNTDGAFSVKQGSDKYIAIDTTDTGEDIAIGTGVSGTAITIGHTTSETTVQDNLTVTGNLKVNGDQVYQNVSSMAVTDPIISLQTGTDGANLGADSNKDVGLAMFWHNGSAAKTAFLGFDDSAGKLTFIPDASISSEVASGSVGVIVANLEGDVTGDVTGTSSLVTVTDSTANTDFPVVFNNESNGLLDDTGAFEYNPSTGTLIVANLDIGTNVDVDGTLEADAITVNGTALDTHIAGVTVTNATNSAHVLVTDNESTNEENLITFVEGATSSTGNVGLEMDGNLTYNPSTGTVTATGFSGNLTGTLQTAAQANVTSLGTLTTLTVDNVIINGTTIGHTDDTDLITLADGAATFAGKVNVVKDQNADSQIHLYNANTGTAAEANVYVTNTSATSTGLFLGATGSSFTTADGFVQDGAHIGSGSNASGGLSIMTRASAAMRFYTNGHTNERMRIDGAHGDVTIITSYSGSTDPFRVGHGTYASFTPTFTINDNGYVGIGTDPDCGLEVYGANNTAAKIKITNTNATDNEWSIYANYNTQDLIFLADSAEVLRLGDGPSATFAGKVDISKGAVNGTSFADNQLLRLLNTSTTDGSRMGLGFCGNTSVGSMLAMMEGVNDDQSAGHTSIRFSTYGGSWNSDMLILGSNGNATFSGSVDIGTFTIASSGIVADAGMTLQIGGGSVNALTLADSSGNATFAANLNVSGTNNVINTGNSGNFDTNDALDYPRITLSGASAQLGLFRSSSSVGGAYIGGDSSGFKVRTADLSSTTFHVDTSGNTMPGQYLWVNTTATIDSEWLAVKNTTSGAYACIATWNNATSGTVEMINFYTETSATARGQIVYSNSSGDIQIDQLSDRSLKENIKDLDGGLKLIGSLKPRIFDFKDEESGKKGVKNKAGFIAQEVEEVKPEWVNEKKGLKTLPGNLTGGVVPYLIKAIQELEARVKELENK